MINILSGSGYYYLGQERWTIFWPNPNYFASFLVTLFPVVWFFAPKRPYWASFFFEIAMYVVLFNTFSRGALVALVAGAATLLALSYIINPPNARPHGYRSKVDVFLLLVVLRPIIGILLAHYFSFGDRIIGWDLSDRQSALNRLDIWHGALRLVEASPLFGWRGLSSGELVTTLVSRNPHLGGLDTVVSGILTVATQRGLLELGLWLSVYLAPIVGLGICLMTRVLLMRRAQHICICCTAILVSWLVCNLFSTLCYDPYLWIVPIIAHIVLTMLLTKHLLVYSGARVWILACSVAAIATVVIYCLGALLQGRAFWRLEREDDFLSFVAQASGPTRKYSLYVDHRTINRTVYSVLEEYRLSLTSLERLRVFIGSSGGSFNEHARGDNVILMGRYVAHMRPKLGPAARLILVCPVGPPTDNRGMHDESQLYLPLLDSDGSNLGWLAWAAQSGAKVAFINSDGRDFARALSEVLQAELSHE